MIRLILAFLALLSPLAAGNTPDEMAAALFDKLKSGEISEAVAALSQNNSDELENEAGRLKFEKHFGDLMDIAGELRTYELLETRKIGKTVEGQVYLLNHEKMPAQLVLVFYKPEKAWALKYMNINLNVSKDLSQSLLDSNL